MYRTGPIRGNNNDWGLGSRLSAPGTRAFPIGWAGAARRGFLGFRMCPRAKNLGPARQVLMMRRGQALLRLEAQTRGAGSFRHRALSRIKLGNLAGENSD